MKIVFVLPEGQGGPVGGYRVVYEYANRLSRRGHVVTVLHVWGLERRPSLVRLVAGSIVHRRPPIRRYRPAWFDLDAHVASLALTRWSSMPIRGADVVVATSWRTAQELGSRPNGLYLIQHYEDWAGPRDAVDATWRLDLQKVVIADWLVEKSRELGAGQPVLVPNAIDDSVFGQDIPPALRTSNHVAMLWHSASWKGSKDGLAALTRAREEVPTLTATFFSTSSKPSDLPEWIKFHHNATQSELRRIYNDSPIFLSPSHTEGSPLPPSEAMACGAALISTDIPGVADRAIDNETALLVPVGDIDAMARAIVMLCNDREHRVVLADAGRERILSKFSWDCSTDILENAMSTRMAQALANGRLRF